MGRLADKNILITGGNSGIGLAAAQEFDREGARVAICGLNEGSLAGGQGDAWTRKSRHSCRRQQSRRPRHDVRHDQAGVRAPGRLFVNAGHSDFRLFEEVTEQSFEQGDSRRFQRGLLHDSKKALPLLRQGSSVIINASVGARKGWPTTSIVSTCKAAVVHLARILSAELVDRRDSGEYPEPRPDGHGDVRSRPR